MDFLQLLPMIKELGAGALSLVVLSYLFHSVITSFQDQNSLHNEQTNRLIQALADNNAKLAELVEVVSDGVRRDEDIHKAMEEQQKVVNDIKTTVEEIKEDIEGKKD